MTNPPEPTNPQPVGCSETITNERNRYYVGKFFCPDDFQVEQDYARDHHYLHNRLLHGWGIVCGLDVARKDPSVSGCPYMVEVKKGIAIDPCGREVILFNEDKHAVDGTYLKDVPDPDKLADGQFLCLRYWEKDICPTKSLCSETGAAKQQFDRVREFGQLEWVPRKDVDVENAWPDPCQPAEPNMSCLDGHVPFGGCESPKPGATAENPRTGYVPLALITKNEEFERDKTKPHFKIDLDRRRYLRQLPPTKITGVNWPHGGLVPLSVFKGQMNGQLCIHFDGKIRKASDAHNRDGINKFTFLVEITDDYGEFDPLKRVPPYENYPQLDDGESIAKFKPKTDFGSGKTVFVTLKCDFVIDKRCQPVDGNHLRGHVPCIGSYKYPSDEFPYGDPPDPVTTHSSGNGQPGGVFYSWFTIVSDEYASSSAVSKSETKQ